MNSVQKVRKLGTKDEREMKKERLRVSTKMGAWIDIDQGCASFLLGYL